LSEGRITDVTSLQTGC